MYNVLIIIVQLITLIDLCARVCVRVCVRACVRVCVCVRACAVRVYVSVRANGPCFTIICAFDD
mgnify:CR=1 FL=1